jgi:hypothetical protein
MRAVTDDGIKCLLIGTAKSGAEILPQLTYAGGFWINFVQI